MFDFEKLDLYTVVRKQNVAVFNLLANKTIDETIASQWKDSSLKCLFNLVQGTGRIATEEKKKYLNLSRGHVFECTTMLQASLDLEQITEEEYDPFYEEYERISKMLLGMLRSYS